MSDLLLSILIPTLPERKTSLDMLMNEFIKQLGPVQSTSIVEPGSMFDGHFRAFFRWADVEIIQEHDDGGMTTGMKRQCLNEAATGKYVAHFDDDDLPSDHYIEWVTEGCRKDPDIIGIRGILIIDGDMNSQSRFEQSTQYKKWEKKGVDEFRGPTHLNPIRRDIALRCPFNDVRIREDWMYCKKVMKIHENTPLRELMITRNLYLYQYRSTK